MSPNSEGMLGISSHLSALLSPYLPTWKLFVGEPFPEFLCVLRMYVCTFCTRCMPVHDAGSGLVSSSTELLAFACRQFEPKLVSLCPLHSHCVILLVSERRRRKPPAERSALYNNAIIQQFRISVSLIAHVPGNNLYYSPSTHQNAHTAVVTS